jgi:hypothetical protein
MPKFTTRLALADATAYPVVTDWSVVVAKGGATEKKTTKAKTEAEAKPAPKPAAKKAPAKKAAAR